MKLSWAVVLGICFYSACGHADYNLSVSANGGLPMLHHGGAQILKSKLVFFGKDWAWARQYSRFKVEGPYKYSTSGRNKVLPFKLSSKIQRSSEKQLSWTFDLDASENKKGIVGGGIIFKLDVAGGRKDFGEPELLADNRGWRWVGPKQQGIEILFEPALPRIFFERGRKSEIRAYFYKDQILQGNRQYTMTVNLSGGVNLQPSKGERFGLQNAQKWPQDRIGLKTLPIDLSFLNADEKPAGKHGFIAARGDKLVFEDGTEARFWGTNVSAYSLFKSSKTNITRHAKRLSSMGFNLVRLHAHDAPWVNPNIFGKRWTTPDTQQLNKDSLDSLDWWIKSLKDEGIYVWLDLHVERNLRAKDNIFAFDEINKKHKKSKKHKGVSLKGYNYVNQTIKDAMIRFNRDYVTHLNSYTKLAYKDEPAIIAMLLTNENDVTNHFGNILLPKKNVPQHSKKYMREARAFANKHGLPAKKTWHAWKHGPSKLFLNDLENQFNETLIKDLRQTGVKVPIVTTNTWGRNPLASLPALTSGDMIDVHTYGRALELEKNPLFAPGITSWMAAGQVADKPMSVTEWNVSPFPTPDRHTSSLLVASKASHQGWDAMMQFGYSSDSLNKVGKPSNWHAYNDPSLLATLPAAALLYRSGHVKEASTTYYLAPGKALFYNKISPETSVAIRTASERGKLLIGIPETRSLPWLKASVKPENAILVEDYKLSLIEPDSSSVTSDTGEIFRDWESGIYTVNTNKSQLASGWLGGKSLSLADTVIEITTDNATVAVQSLDNKNINQSARILISLATNAVPTVDSKRKRKLPFLSEPLTGLLRLKAPAGLHLSYVSYDGTTKKLPVIYENGHYVIELDEIPLTHWLLLTP